MSTKAPGAIFVTRPESFCAAVTAQPQCTVLTAKACTDAIKSCEAYAKAAMNQALAFFHSIDLQANDPKRAYTLSDSIKNLPADLQMTTYLDPGNFSDSQNAITCLKPSQPGPGGGAGDTTQASTISITNFRLRGKSDDLYIDRGTDPFKSATPTSLSWTGTDYDNYSVKVTGALGYQIPTATGEVIPYISTYQSLTDASKKPRVIDPNNNVALGMVAANSFIDSYNHNILNWFSAKPQYLFNTADRSEIGSVRLIYAPWVDSPVAPINTFSLVPGLPGPIWASLIFDLRNDTGVYAKLADTKAIAATDKNFDRFGSRFGLSLSTAPGYPSIVITATEVYLYSAFGYYRNVNSFQSTLTYNLESNNYVGFTLSYQNGRDEDTAVASHNYSAGFTVKY